jgi:hypothetical protein
VLHNDDVRLFNSLILPLHSRANIDGWRGVRKREEEEKWEGRARNKYGGRREEGNSEKKRGGREK